MSRCCSMIVLLYVLMNSPAQARALVVGMEDLDYYPQFSLKRKDAGIAYQILHDFAQQEGLNLRFEAMPIKRLARAFYQQQTLDFVYPDNPRWSSALKRGHEVHYSHPVVYSEGVTFVLDNQPINWAEPVEMSLLRGHTFPRWDKPLGKINVVEAADPNAVLGMLLQGRVRAAHLDLAVARMALQYYPQSSKAHVIWDKHLPYSYISYHLSTLSHSSVIAAFNRYLLKNKQKISKLVEDYQLGHLSKKT